MTAERASLYLVKGEARDPDQGIAPKPLTQPLMIPSYDNIYVLVRQWEYVWRDDKLRHKIIVPCGNESDGASVPRLAWTLAGITPDGLIRAAALVHDLMYAMKGEIQLYFQAGPNSDDWKRVKRTFSRRQADDLFHQIMREAGIGPIKAYAAYRMVRIFGFWAWGS